MTAELSEELRQYNEENGLNNGAGELPPTSCDSLCNSCAVVDCPTEPRWKHHKKYKIPLMYCQFYKN